MKIEKGVPKRLSAVAWLIFSSVFLWLLSFADVKGFSLKSFFQFSAMLFGGGAAYHFLINMLQAPYNDGNRELWFRMTVLMFSMLGCFLFAGGAVAFDRFIWPQNGLLSVLGIGATYIVACFFGLQAEKVYRKLLDKCSNQPLESTRVAQIRSTKRCMSARLKLEKAAVSARLFVRHEDISEHLDWTKTLIAICSAAIGALALGVDTAVASLRLKISAVLFGVALLAFVITHAGLINHKRASSEKLALTVYMFIAAGFLSFATAIILVIFNVVLA